MAEINLQKMDDEKTRRSKSIKFRGAKKYTSGTVQGRKGKTCRLYLRYVGTDGKPHNKTKKYTTDAERLSADEAEDELARWQAQLEQELADQEEAERRAKAEAAIPTVANYMREYIDSKAAKQEIERRTVSDYNSLLNTFIAPHLGAYRINELTPDIVDAWVNKCVETHAPRTVRKALVLLRSAMQLAVDRDKLTKDPTRTVKAPKVAKVNPNALDAMGRAKALQHIELELQHPTENPAFTGYALALLMGMRQGEICGLKWRYVDLEHGTLKIREALGHDNDAKGADHWYTKEPKSETSRRDLDIPEQLITPLKKLKAKAIEDALKQGADFNDFYVIGFADGSPMNGDMLSTRWRKTASSLGLKGTQGKRPTFHDLRHTFATASITSGKDVKTVSSILGHYDASMTLNIYASADPNAKKAAMQGTADSMYQEAKEHANDGQVIEFEPKTGTEG